jgi:hypothetical protein
MNIEEARKVLWLNNYPRPLGELFDEGYLNRSRLEWAIEKARDPQLREAAKIFLEILSASSQDKKLPKAKAKEKYFPVEISIEKARATLWPFAPYKGQPMGALVESKQLSLKDLGYAIESAWAEQKVKQAAIVLSLMRLEQVVKEPVPSAGLVHVNSGGRSYSDRKQTWLTLLEGMIFGFLAGFVVFIMVVEIINIRMPHPNSKSLTDFTTSPTGIIVLVLALLIMLLILGLSIFLPDQITKRLDKEIEEYRFGQEGENRMVEIILQALDGNWHLFRNISLPGRNKGDLDLILVGPPGVWVLEVKNFRGEYRNIGDSWEYRSGKNWKVASANPSQQALKNALRLANFLKADGLNVFVNPVVIWANQDAPLFVENPSAAVWLYNRLADELGNIWHGEKLSQSEREKIANKLSKLCEDHKK